MHRRILWNVVFQNPLPSNSHPKTSCGPNVIWFAVGDEKSFTMAIFQKKYNVSLRLHRNENLAYYAPYVAAIFEMDLINALYSKSASKHALVSGGLCKLWICHCNQANIPNWQFRCNIFPISLANVVLSYLEFDPCNGISSATICF